MGKLFNEAPLPPIETFQPTTASALLRLLNTHDASVEKQKIALRDWLTDNDPAPSLRISLRRNGYGLLLDDVDELKGIKKPPVGVISRLGPR